MPLRQESLTVLGIRLFCICIFIFLSSIFCTLVVSAQDCLSHRCAEFMRCYTGGPGGVPISIDFEGACPSIPLVGSHCPSFPSMSHCFRTCSESCLCPPGWKEVFPLSSVNRDFKAHLETRLLPWTFFHCPKLALVLWVFSVACGYHQSNVNCKKRSKNCLPASWFLFLSFNFCYS